MRWSWKIARLAGIDVYIHSTFFLLVAWFGYYYWKRFGSIASAIEGMAYIVALFSCVILHEFGHALMAKRFNITTQKITLLPIGGVASMEKLPTKPIEEIKVALAGPAVNLVIALILWLLIAASNLDISNEKILETGGPFIFQLMLVNIVLVIFNLLPAFPMDGGRVLRAIFAMRMKHHKATEKASVIGQRFAIIFGVLGLFYNPFLLLIAVFLWFGAAAENQSEQMQVSLANTTARDVMITDFHILSPDDHLSKAIQITLAGSQKDFPVGTRNTITGVLTQADLLRALQDKGEHGKTDELELRPIKTVEPDVPVQLLLEEVQSNEAHMIAVNDDNKIVGLVNLENIIELLQIQTALKESRQF